MSEAMWLVLLLLLWLSPVAPNWETGSCSQPQPLCCLGIDNHCKSGNCYCDAFCHEASDCCPDHHALCSPAPLNTKMVLQMVLRMENPPSPKRSNLNRVQSMVQQFLQTSLPEMPLSISVKGTRKRA
ncbi:PREDICTED: tubulointerstitial nephritis antigen-like isoform X2 [Myotis brandtii]|uniref:tubulointerstitial nephritis antigen-like isoform X2 n=1 Tax=Myotis brandtii TaxID=109478 RepID=UPI0007045A6A|nr:PREDICTED: tubulointerstitial nephritis antigen-like isoform X2 [Myotis brandtii]